LERDIDQTTGEIHQYLRIYEIEPLGWVLADWLHLPIPVIGGVFAFLYFGVLLVLHNIAGHPLPTNLRELFHHPSTHYYYPNLIGIGFDLIGNPLFFVFLAILKHYIPRQFVKLEQDGLIKERRSLSCLARFVRFSARNRRAQIIAMIVIPVVVSSSSAVLSIWVLQPADTPGKYAIFLSLLGTYAKSVVVVQLVYIFLILSNYSLDMKLNLAHPDHCSGLAPFGNLAMAVYAFLFFLAMFQAIGTSAGGGALEKTVINISGSVAYLYLWFLFPLAILYVLDQLLYTPHRAMRDLQRRYLETSSRSWTSYHQNILASLLRVIEVSEDPLIGKTNLSFGDDLELLETWARLDKYVTEMHTWPISKSTFRTIAILVNPLVPILLPGIVSFIRFLFP
jgi:hypothetical protein